MLHFLSLISKLGQSIVLCGLNLRCSYIPCRPQKQSKDSIEWHFETSWRYTNKLLSWSMTEVSRELSSLNKFKNNKLFKKNRVNSIYSRLLIVRNPRDYKKNSNYRDLTRSLNYQKERKKIRIIKSFYYIFENMYELT